MNNTDEETRYNIQCNIVEKYYKEYDNNLTEWKEVSDLELDLNDRIPGVQICKVSSRHHKKEI